MAIVREHLVLGVLPTRDRLLRPAATSGTRPE